MSTPCVTVVVTNYNYAEFLSAALDGVFAQTQPPDEVIVVDDGSTDASHEIIRQYPVKAILQPNGGQAAALNAGVASAKGDIICLLDADDVWKPDKVARIVEVFQRQPNAMWSRHPLEITDATLHPLGVLIPRITKSKRVRPSRAAVLERALSASTSAISFRRQVIDAVFPLTRAPELRFDADALIMARMAGRFEGWQVSEALGYYRKHERQQFAGVASLERMLERQVVVGSMLADELLLGEPVSNYKHRLILATLRQQPRLPYYLKGTVAALQLSHTPVLMLRQWIGLSFAMCAAKSWLAVQQRKHGSF